MSDIDTAAADSLKALDPKRPIREADIRGLGSLLRKLMPEPGSISASGPDTDDVSHALAARSMPPHLHDRADPDVPPRAFRPTDHEPGLVGDLVSRGPAPANGCEVTGRIVARGHGTAPSG